MSRTITYSGGRRAFLPVPPLGIVEKVLAERSLFQFTKQAWSIVEPKEFIYGWHIEAICEHVQAVVERQIRNLVINIPPRHTKSLSSSVFLTPWAWTSDSSLQFLYSSYAGTLALRDSARARRVIQSMWYQRRWHDRFQFQLDSNQKIKYETDKNGYRLATSVDGLGTGEGGDFIIVDDPHNVKEGESDVKRQGTLLWWDETMSSRLNEPERGGKIVIMQRVHEADLSGHVLEEMDYEHLCLPARYEGKNRCRTSLGFIDPRIEKDQPLHEERLGDAALTLLRRNMTEYAWAGQYQQRPAPRGGGMFKVGRIQIIKEHPPEALIAAKIRYWDKAGTQDGGKRTAGVLMYRMAPPFTPEFVIADIVKGQWSAGPRETQIKMTASLDGKEVQIWVEQEPGSGGKESAETTIKGLAGYACFADRVSGDKETRAEPLSAQVENYNVGMLLDKNPTKEKRWNRPFLDELEVFPFGKFSDQGDAASGAFNKLVLSKTKRAGVW